MESVEDAFRRGVEAQRRGDLSAAADAYRAVLRIQPGNVLARNNLSFALIALGDYAEGFRLYDARFERSVGRVLKPSPSFPEWRGEDLRGRSLLVFPEQGFGDQILLARFATTLAEAGATVSMLTPPPLVRLFRHLPVRVIPAIGAVEVPPHDFWSMIGSLPGRMGVTEASLPTAPYLPSKAGGRGVGLTALAGPFPPGRSLPDALRDGLLALPGVRSLAPEDTGAADFEATREIIESLDTVVSVDTATAHLAAAMGKPCFVLMWSPGDWRWGRLPDRTPWYPSARLFRQPTPGDWPPVVDTVRAALGGG
jgi:hypothetical protein